MFTFATHKRTQHQVATIHLMCHGRESDRERGRGKQSTPPNIPSFPSFVIINILGGNGAL